MLQRPESRSSNTHGRAASTHRSAVRSAAVLALLHLLILSCSFDYQQVESAGETDRPDYILDRTTYTVARSYSDTIAFTAEQVRFYEKTSSVTLEGVNFSQSSASGELLTRGSSDSCQIDTDTNDTRLIGNIQIVSETEQTIVIAQELFWRHDQDLLTSPDGLPVTVQYSDGSSLSGTGFRADLSLRSIEFAQSARGTIQHER